MIFGDLRGWIDHLREQGELHEINAEVDWDVEIGTVVRKAIASGKGPALLFNNIKDYKTGRCTQIFAGSMSSYERIALMFGKPKDTPITELVSEGVFKA